NPNANPRPGAYRNLLPGLFSSSYSAFPPPFSASDGGDAGTTSFFLVVCWCSALNLTINYLDLLVRWLQQPQIILLKEGTDTSQGKAQVVSNINACTAVADVVRTTLGPRGMDKLIHDEKGSTTISNDGATIMKLLDVVHPAAKILVDIAKSQDSEVTHQICFFSWNIIPKDTTSRIVPGGNMRDSFLVNGVAFKKTFSYAGFEQQPKKFLNPKILLLNIELELKSEKENAEIR
ncbi:hypothetical protein BHE74_00021304, partial [Ensete ventricosum]